MESSSGGNSCGNNNNNGIKSSPLSLSRKLSGATASPRKGVQKFYTKIRHKIEDSMPPKISVKLNKNNNNSSTSDKVNINRSNIINSKIMNISEISLIKRSTSSSELNQNKPIPPPRGLINKKQKIQNLQSGFINTETEFLNNMKSVNSKSTSASYENLKISTNPNGLLDDSDEDYLPPASMNNSNLSLEDEIFEELEKVAHDEAKLNAVLKNFDKILADFTSTTGNSSTTTITSALTSMTTSTPILKTLNSLNSSIKETISLPATKVAEKNKKINDNSKKIKNNKSEGKTSSHKPLQKSKTCSIIESRCILKKSISDPTKNNDQSIESLSISNDLQHFAALQVTKSLWNLQDFEAFAKSGEKIDKVNHRLSTYKVGKKLSSLEVPYSCSSEHKEQLKQRHSNGNESNGRLRSQLPRATSVWEVSSSGSVGSLVNLHSLCSRTSSGSKIPIKKNNPQRLFNSGRSNSFCSDQSFNSSASSNTNSSSITLLKTNTLNSNISNAKIIQVGKVLPTPKRSVNKIISGNKFIKNLNEINAETTKANIVKRTASTNSLMISLNTATSSTITGTATITNTKSTSNSGINKKHHRIINSASSTPHSLNKIGIPSKSPVTVVRVSATVPSKNNNSILKPSLKNSNSDLSLNNVKPAKSLSAKMNNSLNKKLQQNDILQNKNVENAQEEVEMFGNVKKLERAKIEYSKISGQSLPLHQPIHHQQLQKQIQSKRLKETKDDFSCNSNKLTTLTTLKRVSPQTSNIVVMSSAINKIHENQNEKNLNQSITIVKEDEKTTYNHFNEFKNINHNDNSTKKTSTSSCIDVVDSSFLISSQKSLPQICYAKECTIKYPRLESCKIIPPLLCHPSQQHAELLVNVKNIQQPLRVHQDSMLCINSDIIRSEKDYHSDCSEDSGHISNENDELIPTLVNDDKYTTSNSIIMNNKQHQQQHNPINDTGINSNKQFIKTQKGINNKISELLEKFESQVIKDNSSSSLSTTSSILMTSSTITSSAISSLSSSFIQKENKNNDNSNNNLTLKKQCTSIKIAEVKPVKCIKSSMEIYPTYSSEVLFRSGILSQLEAKRDELLSDRIVQLQAYCRGYLARRRVAQRRVQELAVRCIQRNVKAFLAVRDWPWWRLLVRVTPLLNVHRTEEQLKIANDELQTLRVKLEKIENDRNALKTENDKLEIKLSEMAVDLAEERSSANMVSERLEAETAERLKLEKELQESQTKVKNLQETSEKLEMELICAKSDLNGISEDEDADNDDGGNVNNGGVYKLKYERVARELEFTKRRLQTQHEHDLEQLVGLKKQLEKKLADAYEEVEEQRQVVGQWKRKTQKMTNEMNDLRMLLEEQNGRNNILEKKQRKFDVECQALQDATRQERQAKDRLAREKDVLIAEKFTLEQNLADTRLELELKEEKLAALQRELEEITFGGSTEEEMAQLKRSKMEFERRVKEQEEELDEMAGQVQLLEQAKLRLEMTLETMRKEARREAQQRDEELEETRGSAYKKIKGLECQLETEHEERTLLLREKHELERRLQTMEEQDRADRAAEEAVTQKLKRDLRKYKALLKDAHAQLERLKADSPGKTLIRQLRNQLEDAETARTIAVKARQTAESDLHEAQTLLDELQRAKSEAEDKATIAHRDRTELQAQLEENEEELAELMKKYSATVKQLNNEQSALSEYEIRISELEAERNSLKEQVAELQQRLENIENMSDSSAAVQSKRLELRAKELESRLELEQATRARLEVQSNRYKDALEKMQNEVAQSKLRELQAQETLKKVQKSLRELREEFQLVSNREQESLAKRKDLEKRLETAEAEAASLRNDLRLALQRIADLQQAMEEGDDDVTESDSDSTDASLSDLEQRLKPIHIKRTSLTEFNTTKDTNGSFDDTLVIKEKKSDNSPRITITSPQNSTISEKHKNGGDTRNNQNRK